MLAAGAEGAWVGTAFVATQENTEVPEIHKTRIVQLNGGDTVYTEVMDIIHTRLRATRHIGPLGLLLASTIIPSSSRGGRENELRACLDTIIPTYTEALQRGDRDIVPVLFGQSADFVQAVRPAAEVLREMCETAEQFSVSVCTMSSSSAEARSGRPKRRKHVHSIAKKTVDAPW